jgi:hypothetical protein
MGEIEESWLKRSSGFFDETNDLNNFDLLRNANEHFRWSDNNDSIGKKRWRQARVDVQQ